MCTREEVKLEVQESERRVEARMEKSHMAIAQTISNLMDDIRTDMKSISEKQDESILDRNSIHAMLDNLKEGQCKILEQTTKHNGRMSSLELWQSYVIGAVAVLTVLVLPILFMIVSEIISHLKLEV